MRLTTKLAATISLFAGVTSQIAFAGPRPNETSAVTRLQPWTPETSVGVRYFDDEAYVSPDRSKFAILSLRGDLGCNCYASDLKVFVTSDVQAALSEREPTKISPVYELTLKSATALHWTENNELELWADDEAGRQQLFSIDVAARKVEAKTRLPSDGSYYYAGSGLSLAIRRGVGEHPLPKIVPAQYLSQKRLERAILGNSWNRFVGFEGEIPWEVRGWNLFGEPIAFLGSRNAIISLGNPDSREDNLQWLTYDGFDDDDGRASIYFGQLAWIDVAKQTITPLIESPAGTVTVMGQRAERRGVKVRLFAAKDEDHLILVNMAQPLNGEEERKRTAYILGHTRSTGATEALEPLEATLPDKRVRRVSGTAWLVPGEQLWVGHEIDGKPAPATVYTLHQEHWVGTDVDASVKPAPVAFAALQKPELPTGLKIEVRQDMNTPPMVVATDGKHEINLVEPDPALQGIDLIPQRKFEWKEADGSTQAGGLVLPRNAKGPVALVIQAYKFEPDLFHPDGPSSFTYAGQILAANGIAVLNIDLTGLDKAKMDNGHEGPDFVDRIDAAVKALAAQHVVDPGKVGIIGFSRGGFEAYYAITHPKQIKLKAAIIDDAYPGTYQYKLTSEIISGNFRVFHPAMPFWGNEDFWSKYDPSLNVHRVAGATLFSTHGGSGAIRSAYIDTIGGFRLGKRPLEFLLYEDSHAMQKARNRLESYRATLDWMAFWLKGVEPSDPSRSVRWLRMKSKWERQQAWEAAGHSVGSMPDESFQIPATTSAH